MIDKAESIDKNHPALQNVHLPDGSVQCSLCHHRCTIREGKTGRCGVRVLRDGVLYAGSYGLVSAEAVDPIEKKPLYHFLPGTRSYSLGSIGCNFLCSHCQNWHISRATADQVGCRYLSPEEGVKRAEMNKCASISWTYNEPTIWYEYSLDMARIARKNGLGTVYVTNGYMTEEALADLAPYLSAWRVDIKSFSEDFYRKVCRAKLSPVLDTAVKAHELGLHVETVTLIIPGLNDGLQEMGSLIDWTIENLGVDTPMHFTRFHPDYQMIDRSATPLQTLETIYELAKEKGIRYPYLGNVMNHRYEHTYCPYCHEMVIERSGFSSRNHLNGSACGYCGKHLAVIRSI